MTTVSEQDSFRLSGLLALEGFIYRHPYGMIGLRSTDNTLSSGKLDTGFKSGYLIYCSCLYETKFLRWQIMGAIPW